MKRLDVQGGWFCVSSAVRGYARAPGSVLRDFLSCFFIMTYADSLMALLMSRLWAQKMKNSSSVTLLSAKSFSIISSYSDSVSTDSFISTNDRLYRLSL